MLGKRTSTILLIYLAICHCLQVIIQKVNVSYINHKYIKDGTVYVKRFGRRSPYYMNIEGTTLQAWAENVTIHFVFYEYLHNEYRRSFLESHFNFCKFIKEEPFFGAMVKMHGITCPCPPKTYRLVNMTLPVENFKYVIPFEHCKLEVMADITDTAEPIFKVYGIGTLKAEKNGRKRDVEPLG